VADYPFSIGATGHIGSAVLNAVHARFPDLEIVALVRDNAKANEVFACFENVKTIIGDFRDLAIIESESMASDIVLSSPHSSKNLGSYMMLMAIRHIARPISWK
jgi:putative NADH-flavin reductase